MRWLWNPAYYRGEWQFICIMGAMVAGGARMLWSSFRPLDEYTRRLRGEQPLWGRSFGVGFGLVLLVVGLGFLSLLLLGSNA